MSADNYIAVHKFPKGYAVWMGFASDEEGDEPHNPRWFSTAKEAAAYAQDWYEREAIVEYGLSISASVMAELTA